MSKSGGFKWKYATEDVRLAFLKMTNMFGTGKFFAGLALRRQ